MNVNQIIINDQVCDVSGGTVIAITLQSFKIGEFTKRFSGFTNRFKLPKTNNNITIFGNADYLNSSSRVQYVSNSVRLVQNGITVINDGFLIFNESNDGFNITIYDAVIGFSELLGESKLIDLPYADATAAKVSPTINYNITGYSTRPYPSYLYSDLIESIITNSGFTYSGSVFSSNDYLRLIIPYSRDAYEYDDSFALSKEFKASTVSKVITPSGAYQKITFDNTIINGSEAFYNGSDEWEILSTIFENNYFTFSMYCDLLVTASAGGTTEIAITQNGAKIGGDALSFASLSAGANQRVSLQLLDYDGASGSPPGTPGNAYSVQVITDLGTPGDLTVTSAVWYVKVTNEINAGNDPDWRFLLPDYRQIDLLKDFMIRFGLVPVSSNGNIEFKNIEAIINDRANAVDWTSKRVPSESDSIKFEFGNYAQSNVFKYSNNDETVNSQEGNYTKLIDNVNLKKTVDIFESDFNNTLTTLVDFSLSGDYINMAQIPIYDGSDISNDPGLRLLMQRARYTNESGSGNVGYFIEPREAYQCSFEYFVIAYYASLFTVLGDIKSVSHLYNLNESDISSFDPTKLIFDNGNYYAFPEIKNYMPGKISKVTMLKI